MLFDYLKQTQRFIHDSAQHFVNPEDLKVYVNRARREIAMRTQAIRRVPPISGSIMQIGVTAQGSGYTAPVVTISPPDFPNGMPPSPSGRQATAIATVIGGAIDSINIVDGGSGYFQPIVTITDATGTGAVVAVSKLTPMNLLQQGQELYPFSSVDMSSFPGVGAIYAVHSISILYANYRYSLPVYSFSVYQAKIRQYPFQYQWVPTVATQLGQGAGGQLLVYPIPSQPYQWEWDSFCLPLDLDDDGDYEALPAPWTDGVPYFAAHLAMLEMQNMNSARMYLELFDRQVSRYSQAARPSRVTNIYGRW